jgi:LysR family transcriptional regulator, glycine cleavage system transcriptional activator
VDKGDALVELSEQAIPVGAILQQREAADRQDGRAQYGGQGGYACGHDTLNAKAAPCTENADLLPCMKVNGSDQLSSLSGQPTHCVSGWPGGCSCLAALCKLGGDMKRTHLPLNALRVFEAAARHLSFTRAADELAVTPAAVGQHIRALEDVLGVVLFKRSARALDLTPEAARALPALRAAFEHFEEAVRVMQSAQTSNVLTISVPPSFAAKWLVPRLDRYTGTRPQMQVRVLAQERLADFTSENLDLAIRYGAGGYADMHVEQLMAEDVAVMASPDMAAQVSAPEDLATAVLIHDDSSLDDADVPSWSHWLAAAGVPHENAERGLRFNLSSLVIEAAATGKGVALVKQALAATEIANGRLVRLFNSSQAAKFAYWMVAPEPQWRQKKVQEFIGWLRSEAAA